MALQDSWVSGWSMPCLRDSGGNSVTRIQREPHKTYRFVDVESSRCECLEWVFAGSVLGLAGLWLAFVVLLSACVGSGGLNTVHSTMLGCPCFSGGVAAQTVRGVDLSECI